MDKEQWVLWIFKHGCKPCSRYFIIAYVHDDNINTMQTDSYLM